MSEAHASQDEGRAFLGELCGEMALKLASRFPGLRCVTVFWNDGQHNDPKGSILYCIQEEMDEATQAAITTARSVRKLTNLPEIEG